MFEKKYWNKKISKQKKNVKQIIFDKKKFKSKVFEKHFLEIKILQENKFLKIKMFDKKNFTNKYFWPQTKIKCANKLLFWF